MVGGRFALIVATDSYDDPEISQLTAPRQDAEALARRAFSFRYRRIPRSRALS